LAKQNTGDPLVEMFIFETSQTVELLEQIVLDSESAGGFSRDALNETFRLVHTIKGSSAMMNYNEISLLSHKIEDLFSYIRERDSLKYDSSSLSDLVLSVVDFIKSELEKLREGIEPDGKPDKLAKKIDGFMKRLKKNNGSSTGASSSPAKDDTKENIGGSGVVYEATIFFEDGCQMENIRAFDVVHRLNGIALVISHFPVELIENDQSSETIKKDGFKVIFKSEKEFEDIQNLLMRTPFLKDITVNAVNEMLEQQGEDSKKEKKAGQKNNQAKQEQKKETGGSEIQSPLTSNIISVNIVKLDKLLDLAGEMVIAEAMLTHNPDLAGLELPNFTKTAQHFRKIIDELQDLIMSIRMVPLTITFQKMNRIVHDMNKKLGKDTRLVLIGEDTEVDKNIIEHISDPLMHLVRNSIDHGIEPKEVRLKKGKPEVGTITLEARNEGSEVLIIVRDDGKGFDRQKILEHARNKNLLFKSEDEMTDKEIYSLIFMPGFSTKDKVSEYSGRGVGMDVVMNNIQAIGGTVHIENQPDVGSAITIKIPLTLAIITGMNIKVGESIYTIPIKEVKESFRPKQSDIIVDPDGNEMVMVRGECYPIFRLHERFNVKTDITDFEDGIFVMVEHDNKFLCIFADCLLGQQQVVVKALPNYITGVKKIRCVAGCTLLGDGSISLIINVRDLLSLSR
jgi:two-component system chemotaxis sensor kinase CheA